MKVRLAQIKEEIEKNGNGDITYEDIARFLDKTYGIDIQLNLGGYWNRTVDGDIANQTINYFSTTSPTAKFKDTIYVEMPGTHAYGVTVPIDGEQKSFMVSTNSQGRLDIAASTSRQLGMLGVEDDDKEEYFSVIADYLVRVYGAKIIKYDEFQSRRRGELDESRAERHTSRKVTVDQPGDNKKKQSGGGVRL